MFLFYTLMCRKYLEIDKKMQKELFGGELRLYWNLSFLKILEIVSLTTEDDVT